MNLMWLGFFFSFFSLRISWYADTLSIFRLATMVPQSTFGASSKIATVSSEIWSKAYDSHFTASWCACWRPRLIAGALFLPTFVFLILASLPILIPEQQPKQNFNVPFINLAQSYFLYHFIVPLLANVMSSSQV